MSAPLGNNRAEKSQEERLRIFEAYCEHVRKGYTKNSFPLCDRKTIKRYIEIYPSEFPSQKIEEAEREGQKVDEDIGRQGMLGKIPNFNATAWIFWMKNKHHWCDSQKQIIESKSEVNVKGEIEISNIDDRIEQLINGAAKNS